MKKTPGVCTVSLAFSRLARTVIKACSTKCSYDRARVDNTISTMKSHRPSYGSSARLLETSPAAMLSREHRYFYFSCACLYMCV